MADDQGRPSLSAKDIATRAAAEAVRGPQPAQQPEPLPSQEAQYLEEQQPRQPQQAEWEAEPTPQQTAEFEAEEGVESVEQVAQEIEQETTYASLSREDLAQFSELGIDLPFDIDDIPEDAEPYVADMAQSLLDVNRMAAEKMLEAQEATLQIKDFAEQFNSPEGQQRVLMTLAMNNPEVFSQTIQTFQRMQEDPEFAELTRRELATQAREEALNRRETAMTQAQRARKATQVESRTSRLARRLGIDESFAKQQVANRILLNEAQHGERDISLQEVDEVLKDLATRQFTGQRVRKPEQQRRVKQTPQKSVQEANQTPPANQQQPGPATSGPAKDWNSNLRSAVRTAASRVRNQGR